MARDLKYLVSLFPQSGRRKRGMVLTSCFLIFIQSGIPTQGVVLPSDRVALPVSIYLN